MICTKKKLILFLIFALWSGSLLQGMQIPSAQVPSQAEQHALLLKQITEEDNKKSKIKKVSQPKTIQINFINENLVDIVNMLAELKKVNVILPSKEADKIKTKVTLSFPEKITLDQAWNLLATLLDMAGYSLVQEGDWWEIIKTTKDIAREPLPLYIGLSPEKLPDSDVRIRYIYYLSNLKISPTAMTETPPNELRVILEKLLPDIRDQKNIYLDSQTNSIIVADKASSIKSVMQIIQYLDQIQLQEKLEIIKLRYLSSQVVADLFAGMQDQQKGGRVETRQNEATYFSRNIKIMPYGRGNSLIVLGKRQDIERVKDFVYKYLDVPLDTGQSVLHVYKLQYLDALPFSKVLDRIVKTQAKASTGQAAGGPKVVEAAERFFEEVIITADTPERATSSAETGSKIIGQYSGGNNLIIAARNEDWLRIKQLIEELDIPQPQVIIEVLIAELATAESKLIGSILRNPTCFPLSNQEVNFQSAQVSPVITNINPGASPPVTTPTSIQSNLLGNVIGASAPFSNVAAQATPGTTVVSFNDSRTGSTFGLLEILDSIRASNIISNPHVIATNHTPTKILAEDSRFLPDAPANINSGSTQISKKWIKAPITVEVTPHISSANTVNLDLNINIDRFLFANTTAAEAATGENQGINTRRLRTNANVHSGDILALGGLSRDDDQNIRSQTPILGSIPIIGYFFKNRNKRVLKTNLTVFICPTIIMPRLRGGISTYTTDYVNISKRYAQEGFLFDSLRDPITRWFFKDIETDPTDDIDDFISQDELRRKEKIVSTETSVASRPEQALETATTTSTAMLAPELKRSEAFINQPLTRTNGPTEQVVVPEVQKVVQAPLEAPAAIKKPKSKKVNLASVALPENEPVGEQDTLAARIKELYKNETITPAATA